MLLTIDKPAVSEPPAQRQPDDHARRTTAPYPWDGSPNGMAADGQHRTQLTIQQEVPNIGPVETAPRTSVNPTHEQGWGRAPGWQWGWMRKNIPTNLAFGRNGVKRIGQRPRRELRLNSGPHATGAGKYQAGQATRTPQRGVIAAPQTAYLTAAVPQVQSWGEPL